MKRVTFVGEISNQKLLELEFGTLATADVVLTDEREVHIVERHPADYALFCNHMRTVISEPDMILKDAKNENTVFYIRQVENTGLNVIIKLSLAENNDGRKNSIMTAYQIGQSSLKRLKKKNPILYSRE